MAAVFFFAMVAAARAGARAAGCEHNKKVHTQKQIEKQRGKNEKEEEFLDLRG